jgi:diguanylate cyclase (GGDEF)-like protein
MTVKPANRHVQHSSSYLSAQYDNDWRSLVRLLFTGSCISLAMFCLLQFLAGNYLFAAFELLCCVLLLIAARQIVHMRNPLVLVYAYLAIVLGFLLYIIVMPGASPTAFVWVYVVPVMTYLLLGRVRGAMLSIPFAVTAIILYQYKYPVALDASGLIDLGNALLCGLLIILFMHVYEGRRAAAHQALQLIARTDALTGVASRGSFQEQLVQSIREAERSQQHLTLVILDVDHFKSVNDRWGHDAGDKALQHICKGLGERLRISDTLGRLGGEEFGLILRNTNHAGAEPLLELLRTQICNNPLHYGKQVIELSATFGLAEWPVDGRTADELYRCVDRRLYSGKDHGRNQVVSQEVS